MNDVSTTHGGAMSTQGQGNYFESYGEQVAQKSIVGDLLKFSKGDFLSGEKSDLVAPGTHLIANMDQLAVGWIRWENQKPTEQIMGRVMEGFQAPKRNTLGDTDESLWERDENNKARDPWQFSNYLIMKEPAAGAGEGLYTFATSSRGGLNAIGELCKAFGRGMRTRPEEYPVVELKVDSYVHSNKAYGRIKFPVLDIVGWVSKASFEQGGAEVSADGATPRLSVVPEHPAEGPGRAARGQTTTRF